MENDNLKLVFIHDKGVDIRTDKRTYQFLFSSNEDLDLIDGDDWDVFPAMGRPDMPEDEYISNYIEIDMDILLNLAQNSGCFSMNDCVDGVVSLGYENIFGYDEYPTKRLVFYFGEEYDSVIKKLSLYSNTINLKNWGDE